MMALGKREVTIVLAALISIIASVGIARSADAGTVEVETTLIRGPLLASFLTTIVARGDNSRQTFEETGETLYATAGRVAYGRWRVDGDRYCSVWPPATGWNCYLLFRVPGKRTIVWVDAKGCRTVNWFTLR